MTKIIVHRPHDRPGASGTGLALALDRGAGRGAAPSRSAADGLREYPDLHFVRGEAQICRWIEREDPTLFAEIVQRIREGCWHVVNGRNVKHNIDLPLGKSAVHPFLLTKAQTRKRSMIC